MTAEPFTKVVIERVGGYIADNPAPGSFMFNFGRGVGVIVGCLLTLGVSVEEVDPKTWQSAIGLRRKRNRTRTAWKNQLRQRAQDLFPEYRVTLWAADAMLIARYAMISDASAAKSIGAPTDDPWG